MKHVLCEMGAFNKVGDLVYFFYPLLHVLDFHVIASLLRP